MALVEVYGGQRKLAKLPVHMYKGEVTWGFGIFC